jgi:class 3 adenylate cyclase/tetratricopeptide (TPR) repeat protein
VAVCPSCGKELPPGEFPFCPFCRASLTEVSTSREQRKVVTVLFCDLVASTSLGESTDPEALRALLARYFEQMKAIVERHGGSVEKFIGDAVMAVFGVPQVHEDDALRALRAAVEMREVFPALDIQGRIGLTTGEVVTGTEERLATGDAVNVAARLEQAAQPGEILIGEETYRLTRDVVEVEAIEPLTLKGKAEAVAAHRLLAVTGEAMRRDVAPMVGREREQELLATAWGRVASERSCHLFTILGPAGVGKSRLTAEFLASLGAALVVRGRCLPYGEGITYWPVVEVVKQLPEAELDPAAAETVGALVGDEPLVTSSDEITWAFRKLLEAVAVEAPLVCVFDDVHWGEETFLDLVEHVADLSRDAPILLVCMARPELLDRRPGWAGGKVNATNVLLEPLAPEETELLIESLAHLDEALRLRILETAEGNPLFVEEMVALVQESGDGDVTVPPNIQALLAARLDQLEAAERGVLERGAVEGRVFHRGAVQALGPEEPQLGTRLTSLVRKEFVRPDKAQLPGEDAFRFRHLLIRDAAYDALPKAIRAELHERFANWLKEHGADLVELDEVLGFHLEQAHRYRVELGALDEAAPSLAERAGERLARAGHRAFVRRDVLGAVNLLQRAITLIPDARDVSLDVAHGRALWYAGRLDEAEGVFKGSALRAATRGERSAELRALLWQGRLVLLMRPEGEADRLLKLAAEAIQHFAEAGDHAGQAEAWSALGDVESMRCHWEAGTAACEHALVHARRAEDEDLAEALVHTIAWGNLFGPTPVGEALDWLEGERAQIRDPLLVLEGHEGWLEAMRGHFDRARSLVAQTITRREELGASMAVANGEQIAAQIELLAGDPAAAEAALRKACEMLEQMSERGVLSTFAGVLARTLCTLGCYGEAEEWSYKSEELGASDDIGTQILWRQARGRAIAERDLQGGEALVREAVTLVDQTDMLNQRGDALLDLAEVLELAGRGDEAAVEVGKALALYERKGNLVMAEGARARLMELQGV